MNRFLILTNEGKDVELRVTKRVKDILTGYGKECIFLPREEGDHRIVTAPIPEDIDCIFVIGGDGSVLELCRSLHREVPILGINMGTVGYLTEVELEALNDAIAEVVAGNYILEDRMMLRATFDDGVENVALNDVVLSRSGAICLLDFDIYVNDTLLNTYKADGVVISTPTGSTAYNLSAGGPIVEPTAQLIVITPICPHALNSSSIVLSAEDRITLEVREGKFGTVETGCVSFDGADAKELTTGHRITIYKAEQYTKLMKLNEVSFLEILRKKMKGY